MSTLWAGLRDERRGKEAAPPSEASGFLLLALPSGCWLPAPHGSPWLSARRLGLPSRYSYGLSGGGYGRVDDDNVNGRAELITTAKVEAPLPRRPASPN